MPFLERLFFAHAPAQNEGCDRIGGGSQLHTTRKQVLDPIPHSATPNRLCPFRLLPSLRSGRSRAPRQDSRQSDAQPLAPALPRQRFYEIPHPVTHVTTSKINKQSVGAVSSSHVSSSTRSLSIPPAPQKQQTTDLYQHRNQGSQTFSRVPKPPAQVQGSDHDSGPALDSFPSTQRHRDPLSAGSRDRPYNRHAEFATESILPPQPPPRGANVVSQPSREQKLSSRHARGDHSTQQGRTALDANQVLSRPAVQQNTVGSGDLQNYALSQSQTGPPSYPTISFERHPVQDRRPPPNPSLADASRRHQEGSSTSDVPPPPTIRTIDLPPVASNTSLEVRSVITGVQIQFSIDGNLGSSTALADAQVAYHQLVLNFPVITTHDDATIHISNLPEDALDHASLLLHRCREQQEARSPQVDKCQALTWIGGPPLLFQCIWNLFEPHLSQLRSLTLRFPEGHPLPVAQVADLLSVAPFLEILDVSALDDPIEISEESRSVLHTRPSGLRTLKVSWRPQSIQAITRLAELQFPSLTRVYFNLPTDDCVADFCEVGSSLVARLIVLEPMRILIVCPSQESCGTLKQAINSKVHVENCRCSATRIPSTTVVKVEKA